MKKKLFIVSLVLSMCFSMLSIVNVQAKETIREDHYVNPIYKDVKSSVVHHDIQTYSLEDVEYTSDQEKLVKIFREKLINRESNIVLYYHCDEEITQEFFSNLVHQLFQKAIKHTGNGKEGDYLKWHCQGWTVKASISVNSNKGYDLNIFYDVSYLSSLEQEEKVDEEVSNLLKSLDLSNKTDYQKVKAIYDYICSNVTYDHDNLNDESYSLKYTAYAALINKTAVCQGYASLFYRLALDAGVDTRVISGEAGGPHAWNIVKLNGKYYNLDSTWDAGRSTYAYFLKNTNDFDDHVRDNDYQSNEFIEEYPMWDESYTEIDCNKYGHNYSEPIYKWSVDNMTVTAQRVCANNYEHVEEETVTAQKIVKDPTCTENGIITYIANFKNNAFKPQTKIVDDKKATGHKVVVDQGKEATCTEDGLTEEESTVEMVDVTHWVFTQDNKTQRFDESDDIHDLLVNMVGLTFNDCADYYADEEEKESYGLTDDATVLTITYQSGEEETTLKLTIGATTEDDAYYYVSMDDSDQVNTVSKESVDAVLDAISKYGM